MVGMGNLGLIDQVTETQWNAQLHSLITVKAVSLAWVGSSSLSACQISLKLPYSNQPILIEIFSFRTFDSIFTHS